MSQRRLIKTRSGRPQHQRAHLSLTSQHPQLCHPSTLPEARSDIRLDQIEACSHSGLLFEYDFAGELLSPLVHDSILARFGDPSYQRPF